LVQNLKRLAEEVSEREGCRLYDLEFIESRPRILRVYIDKLPQAEEKVPVSVDDCANVSRGLNLVLDVEDLIPGGAYELEVSSPGLERKLSETWHFESVMGETVKVNVSEPLAIPAAYQGKGTEFRQVVGVLNFVSEDELRIERDGVEWAVPRATVTKANLVFVTEPKGKPSHKNGSKKKKR
jgi:ribosome maturation factor RimP